MANGFYPAMQLQGADFGQFGRGLAQGQQLRANKQAMQRQAGADKRGELARLGMQLRNIKSRDQLNAMLPALTQGLSQEARQEVDVWLQQNGSLPEDQFLTSLNSTAAMLAANDPAMEAQFMRAQRAGQVKSYAPEKFYDPETGQMRWGVTTFNPNTQQSEIQWVDTEGMTPVGQLTPEQELDLLSKKQKLKLKGLQEKERTLESEQLKLEKARGEVQKQKFELGAEDRKRDVAQWEAGKAIGTIDELLTGDLDMIYGKYEAWVPDLFRSQEGLDMMIKRDQIAATIELAQAGKLKGQGQVSEGEREILRRAATILSNPKISPGAARKALQDARESIQRTMTVGVMPQDGQPTKSAPAVDLKSLSDEDLFNF